MKRSIGTLALSFLIVCACSQKKDNGVDEAKKLQRGELSAVATYDQAIAKIDRADAKTALSRIREEHNQAAEQLRARVVALGGTPETQAGPWGAWTKLLTDASGAIGADTLLGTLKTGEKHGIEEYDGAIKDDEVDAETKNLARSLIEKQREHLKTLESLASAQ